MKVRSVWTITLLVGLLLIMASSCVPVVTSTYVPEPNVSASTQVAYAAVRPMQHQRTSGTLDKIDGNMLTLTTGEGPVRVEISSDSIPVRRISTGVLSDLLKEGTTVFAMGPQDASGSIAAASIFVLPQTQGSSAATPTATNSVNASSTRLDGRRSASGTLSSRDGNILTVATPQGPVAVIVGGDTTVQKITSDIPSDLIEGESLAVVGPEGPSGNVIASAIYIEP